jgi:hypothetical protein
VVVVTIPVEEPVVSSPVLVPLVLAATSVVVGVASLELLSLFAVVPIGSVVIGPSSLF